jgi:hypothetical protein
MTPGEELSREFAKLARQDMEGLAARLTSRDRTEQQAVIRELARDAGSINALGRALGTDPRNVRLWLAGPDAKQQRAPQAASREKLLAFAQSRSGQRLARALQQRPLQAEQRMTVEYDGRPQGTRNKTVILDPANPEVSEPLGEMRAGVALGDDSLMGQGFETAFRAVYGLPDSLEIVDTRIALRWA